MNNPARKRASEDLNDQTDKRLKSDGDDELESNAALRGYLWGGANQLAHLLQPRANIADDDSARGKIGRRSEFKSPDMQTVPEGSL